MRLCLAAACLLAVAGPGRADCRGDLVEALDRSFTAGPFHAERVARRSLAGTDASSSHFDIKVVPPNDAESVITGDHAPIGTRTVGGKVWFLEEAGWRVNSVAIAKGWYDSIVGDASKVGSFSLKDRVPSQVECLGSARVEGADYLAYRYFDADAELGTRINAYLDPKTHLLARLDTSMWGLMWAETLRMTYDPTLTLPTDPAP